MNANDILNETIALQMRNASEEARVAAEDAYKNIFDGGSSMSLVIAWEGDRNKLAGTSTAITELEVPPVISRIGDYAFYQSTGLRRLHIPYNVKTIGASSFYGCNNLTTLTFEDGCEAIGQQAFYNCQKITNLVLPNSVKTIGSSAFRNSMALKTLVIGNGCTKIDQFAFGTCTKLESLTIGSGIATLGTSAFYGMPSTCVVTMNVPSTTFTVAQMKSAGFVAGVVVKFTDTDVTIS